jgi:hypothetical protein
MRALSARLNTAQTSAVRIPYFRMVFTSQTTGATKDCSGTTSRVESITHTESAYGGIAKIILNNSDLGVPDLRGYYVEIGYGDVTTTGNEYAATPRLWVRDQTWTSSEGLLISTLSLIDGFTHLGELPIELGTAPEYYKLYNRDTTPYMIIDAALAGAGFTLGTWGMEPASGTYTADAGTNATTLKDSQLTSSADDFYNGWFLYNVTRAIGTAIIDYNGATKTLSHAAIGGQTAGDTYKILKSDEIVTSFKPYFEINADNDSGVTMSYEDRLEVCYRAIMMTKSYLRARPGMVFDVVFPRAVDTVDLAFNTSQFYEFNQKQNEVVPNAIYIFANYTDGSYGSMITGYSVDAEAVARNGGVEIKGLYSAPTVTTQLDADNRAAAILTRIKSESLSVGLVIPHDCRIELYDNIQVTDTRGN